MRAKLPTSTEIDITSMTVEDLRVESRRLQEMVTDVSDVTLKQSLAARALDLAQWAEAVARSGENPGIIWMNIERYRSILASGINDEAQRRSIQDLLCKAERALAESHTLRELADWYREFAERTGNPTIWEARLRTAEDLDAEADRIERRGRD